MRRLTAATLLLGLVVCLGAACGKTQYLQGRSLYLEHCANCHFESGDGLQRLMPPLANSDYLRDRPRDVIRGIRYGMQGPIEVNGVVYDEVMPANEELSEFQIVNIVNYLNHAWGNDYGTVTVAEARTWLAE